MPGACAAGRSGADRARAEHPAPVLGTGPGRDLPNPAVIIRLATRTGWWQPGRTGPSPAGKVDGWSAKAARFDFLHHRDQVKVSWNRPTGTAAVRIDGPLRPSSQTSPSSADLAVSRRDGHACDVLAGHGVPPPSTKVSSSAGGGAAGRQARRFVGVAPACRRRAGDRDLPLRARRAWDVRWRARLRTKLGVGRG
jgi:hypothetical protein